MAEFVRQWDNSESLTATYEGSRDGSAIFTSDTNESIDRTMQVSFVDASRSVVVNRNVVQAGLREVFNVIEGPLRLADGSTFNVLKV